MLYTVVLVSMVVLGAGYVFYGRFLARRLGLDDSRPTPACTMSDGVDFVPAKSSLLLGQHFSAIAAAGPIVGPVLAGIWFGWLPAILWIVLGAIFVGGVHDFTSMIVSVRHKAASIGEIVRRYMSRTSWVLFLIFVWLTLVYVIIAFTDITAQTFRTVSGSEAFGPGVAVSSILYLAVGVCMGIVLRRTKMRLGAATAVFVPLVLLVVWVGTRIPDPVARALFAVPVKGWEAGLLIYCFIASLIPMWLLLQPRGYLGGWFLYLTMAAALFGSLFGGFRVEYPALNLEGFASLENGKLVLPLVFITVACGACSGFHGIVSSGTTSKQICRESDTRVVGYGAMVLEGLVAVLALATVMILPKGDPGLKADPNVVYASGLARYLGIVGVDPALALSFALLAFSTFVYDTLDVCTRLARYILQELFGWRSRRGSALAAVVTLLLPLAFLMVAREKAYLLAWPVFGTSNQLLASFTLLAVSVYLIKTGRQAWFAIAPMIFMMVFTLWALVLQITPFVRSFLPGAGAAVVSPDVAISGVCGIVLLVLSAWLIVEAARVLGAAGSGRGQAARA